MRRLLCGWLAAAMLGLLAACGGGGGGSGGGPAPSDGRLSGADSAAALAAVTDQASQPAAEADIVNGLILSRLDVVFAADATVGQVNAALDGVGASIVAMRAGSPVLSIAVPRQASADALATLAATLTGQPGIVVALPGLEGTPAVGPEPPADADADFLYLQRARFPAAWNARAAARNCANDKVTVIVADKFVRPVDALYAQFAGQVPGVTELGSGSPPAPPGELAEFHGYDVLTTLAAKLDATVPTGANPFPDCMDFKALGITGLSMYAITAEIEAALAATSGKVVINASFGWTDQCGVPDADGVFPPCTPANLRAPTAHARAVWAGIQRMSLAPFADRTLVVSAAGNEANKPVAATYLGAGLATLGSAFNIAATADSAMSFATDTTKWEPSPACTTPPCLPSLTATPAQAANIARVLSNLGAAATTQAANVLVAGSVDNLLLQRSEFSDPGAPVLAVGEGIPTLAGLPAQGTSFAAPQVAGLAAYLWMLSPELRARPARDTAAAIKANASNALVIDGVTIADGLINAYATVLSLDQTVAVSASTAKVRLAILDVNDDDAFDLTDLQRFRDAYLDAAGNPRAPTVRDHGRFDLNGDGFTGGDRTTRMDLDPRGSTRFGAPQLGNVTATVAGVARTFNELAVSDAKALCFYAGSALYSGTDLDARDALLSELCVFDAPVTMQAFSRIDIQVKARPANCSTPERPECDIFQRETLTPAALAPASAGESGRTLIAESADRSTRATGSAQGFASINATGGGGGAITISGNASAGSNAAYTGALGTGVALATQQLSLLANVTLDRPHAFSLQMTASTNGVNASAVLSIGSSQFNASGSFSGSLPAGGHTVGLGALASAVARLEIGSTASSASASFTLTLTPQ
jgi:hypothetical protein